MKCKVFSIIIVCLLFIPSDLFAVGGISNTKVIVPSTDTVPVTGFEVEPYFSLQFVDDSVDTKNHQFGVRLTKGFLHNLEAGISANLLEFEDSDISDSDYNFGDIAAGVKYRFFSVPGFSLAYQGGVTFPTSSGDSAWVYEPFGLILTTEVFNKVSLDADLVFVFEESDVFSVVSNIGAGVFITDSFQPVVELGYEFSDPDNLSSSEIVTLTGGFTANLNKFLTLIMGISKDIYSDNASDSYTLNTALTIAF